MEGSGYPRSEYQYEPGGNRKGQKGQEDGPFQQGPVGIGPVPGPHHGGGKAQDHNSRDYLADDPYHPKLPCLFRGKEGAHEGKEGNLYKAGHHHGKGVEKGFPGQIPPA